MGKNPVSKRGRGLADFLLTVAVILLWLLLTKSPHALGARLTHDGGNGNATRSVQSQSLELEDGGDEWGYAVFARRDALSGDRTLTNAAAVISAGKRFGSHQFYLGLGAHFRQQKLNARTSEAGEFLPAAGLGWHHDDFRIDIAASQQMTRSALSFLMHAGIPFELSSEFEYLYSQPYRWSANVFAFVSRYGGLILGYEPQAERSRAGLWLKPMENLQLRSLARLQAGSETYWEFSLSYTFETVHEKTLPAPLKIKPAVTKKKLPQSVPAFATLVKWGLTPVEALRYAREKNVCTLSAHAQAALARHNWECHDAT